MILWCCPFASPPSIHASDEIFGHNLGGCSHTGGSFRSQGNARSSRLHAFHHVFNRCEMGLLGKPINPHERDR
eukprot:11651550-Karenia_brevis.AAC.1